ncbi:MAG: NADP-dependent malic enzyme [Candidatus Micrarchaeota archaeon]|nr:NADP-dependent malic enzyme [Candidatus Micrarchaeota archaeon]MDE1834794.1 NADP-dependent malic enzyme [Candidatus Micrarchaeota archaeon]MDE1859487.1 NADP-dependent malic enzyme [Candidatus Micrarchaeota archaeon]
MVDKKTVLDLHKRAQGKIEIFPKVHLGTEDELSAYYTPGVSLVSEEIRDDINKVYDYTMKSNTIAIVSDGTRILGLGNIGPQAGLPVMEGKAALFKKFGGVDAIPICVDTKDENEIVKLVRNIAPAFGGINIEDIESPKSFRIAHRLEKELDIPVFHDDRQGTGVVTLAALLNSLKLAGKDKSAKIVVNGAGSAGFGITDILVHSGFKNIVVVDKTGSLYKGRKESMNDYKMEIANLTNPKGENGNLYEISPGADVLIGASSQGAFNKDIIQSMNEKPIVFALANPHPEIEYEEAMEAGAFIVATGRSDRPNQVNNLLAFPGIMRGLLDSRAKKVNYEMLQSAANAIANASKKPDRDHVIASIRGDDFALGIMPEIAAAVAQAAVASGEARIKLTHKQAKERAAKLMTRYYGIEKNIRKYLV